MSNHLFSEFTPQSAKAWKQKIQVDLKGKDYNESLVWNSLEGIDVTPFYHSDDTVKPLTIPHQPQQWSVGQSFFIDDVSVVNGLVRDALQRGAEAISLTCNKTFDYQKLLNNVPFDKAILYFELHFSDPSFIADLSSFLQSKKATFYILLDTLGHLARTGNWFTSQESDIENQLHVLKNTETPTLAVDTSLYQQAGGTMIQQLGYGILQVAEYFQQASINGVSTIAPSVFKVAVGGNYFFEIAKIRALRVLYASVAQAFGFSEKCHIIAAPSLRNKTLYDYNVNMLRTTTEAMSAILGGADTVCNLAYDAIYHKSNEFGERIARNQLLILKEESYFDAVSNPADGTYYIENVTQELATKALALFKELEASGGFLQHLKEGTIQRKIKESAAKEQQLFDEQSKLLVGTNYQPNEDDQMSGTIELYPFIKQNPQKTTLEPIIEKRIAANLEKERLENEK